jgi:hypothetical protein
VQCRSDFRQRNFCILQKLLRELETRFTQELLKVGSVSGKPFAQCPFVYAEQERHVLGRRGAAKYHLPKRTPYKVGKAHRTVGPRLLDGLHDQLVQVGVCPDDGVVKPRGFEHDAGYFGIESNVRTKKAPIVALILGSKMRKLYAQRPPAGSANLSQRPVPDCNGDIV